jgi:preprotein translocase subunit SecG
VFGARGAASFLTKATKWLAIAFFVLTLGMAMYVQRTGLVGSRAVTEDAGVMSGVEVPAAPVAGEVPAAPPQQAPASDVPAAPLQAQPEATPEPVEEEDGN